MLDLAQSGDMAIDRNVKGRIAHYHIGHLSSKQPLIVKTNARIATKHSMVSKHPEVTLLGNQSFSGFSRTFILRAGLLRTLFGSLIKDQINFAERETGDFKV